MDDAERLAASQRAYIIAPAGCGKTHLIAEAVTHHAGGRELILTHTHAGVDVLRAKLRSMRASSSSFDIETIAGWALRYALSFPKTSGQQSSEPNSNDEWKITYAACARLLRLKPIQDIVRASYSGVYVDEYQDCSLDQHELICLLSEILPCRILGDPLQGIFSFTNGACSNTASTLLNVRLCSFLKLLFEELVKGFAGVGNETGFDPSACRFHGL